MRTTHLTHRLAAVAVLALVATSAAACGDDDKDDSGSASDTPTVSELTEDQLGQAVLQPDNFSEGWTQTTDDETEDSAPGCLADVSAITDSVDEAAKVAYDYSYGDSGVPLVTSSASAFDDQDEVTKAFDDAKSALEDCSTVTGTDADGYEYDMTLSYDDSVSEGLDDQVNLTLAGTITVSGQDSTIAERVTMVRLGPNVAVTAMVGLGDTSTVASFDAYEQIAIDRFVAVVNGEDPTAATAPAPE